MQCPVGVLFYAVSCRSPVLCIMQQKLLVADLIKNNAFNFFIQETRNMRNSQLAFLNLKILTRKLELATRKINSKATTCNSQILTRNLQNQLASYNLQLSTLNS